LTQAIDCTKNCFCISVFQQGERLLKYRDELEKFEPSSFNIILFNSDGKYIKGITDSHFSSELEINTHLMPGKYYILVNALWNLTAKYDVCYKDVIIDIYAPI